MKSFIYLLFEILQFFKTDFDENSKDNYISAFQLPYPAILFLFWSKYDLVLEDFYRKVLFAFPSDCNRGRKLKLPISPYDIFIPIFRIYKN